MGAANQPPAAMAVAPPDELDAAPDELDPDEVEDEDEDERLRMLARADCWLRRLARTVSRWMKVVINVVWRCVSMACRVLIRCSTDVDWS